MPEFILNAPQRYHACPGERGGPPAHPFYSLDEFARGYVEAMFFTNCDSGDDNEHRANELGVERLTRASVAAIKRDCDKFLGHVMPDGCFARQWLNRVADSYDDAQAGRDFWFTRQGHGVGFWDREQINLDLFEPINPAPGLGGWELRDDEAEQGPCRGNIRDGLTEAAKAAGEAYPEIWRGWIHYR